MINFINKLMNYNSIIWDTKIPQQLNQVNHK